MLPKEEILKKLDVAYIKKNSVNIIGYSIIVIFSLYLLSGIQTSLLNFAISMPGLIEMGVEYVNENETITNYNLITQSKVNFLLDIGISLIVGIIVLAIFAIWIMLEAVSEIIRIVAGIRTDTEKLDAIIKSLRIRKDEV